MILPKGTIEYQKDGGEEAIKGIMDEITGSKVTGYLLILGTLPDEEGSEKKITGQMVFKEGDPILCETTLDGKGHKGKKGVFPLLKAMVIDSNNVELHTKIDVAPPMAFFKECRIADKDVDLDVFMKAMQEEAEERRRKEEEERQKQEKRAQIVSDVNGWVDRGYNIKDVDKKLDLDFSELEKWYDIMVTNIARIEEIKEWMETLKDRELEGYKKELEKSLSSPDNMEHIEKLHAELAEVQEGLNEKRAEMEKWSNLWKEEGYNTAKLEEALSGDVETAWNVLTEFMDEVQQLKDLGEEIGKIRAMDGASVFQAEMEDITSISKDPNEIAALREKVEALKATIEREKAQKEELLAKAQEWKEMGFSIDSLLALKDERLEKVISEFNTFKDNVDRVKKIEQELDGLDNRDFPDRIKELKADLVDPASIADYEERFAKLKRAIEELEKQREELNLEIDAIRTRGIVTTSIDDKLDLPVPELRSALEELKVRIDELNSLATEVDQIDQRWLDEELAALDPLLKDPDRIDEAKDAISRLRKAISDREERRAFIRTEMEKWKGEGFSTRELETVINEDQDSFSNAYNLLKSKIDDCKAAMSRLDSMDLRFHQEEAEELRAMMMDPDTLPKALEGLESLEKKVEEDLKRRSSFKERLDGLAAEGWEVDPAREVLERQPEDLEGGISAFEENVNSIEEALADMGQWDELEVKWIKEDLDQLNAAIKDISLIEESLAQYEELKKAVKENAEKRGEMTGILSQWEEKGYMVDHVKKVSGENIETFAEAFDALNDKITRLEGLQVTFDSLDTKHFPREAEEIEEKLNDPNLIDEIEKSMEELEKKVEEDGEKRQEYRDKIDALMEENFMGAEKLNDVLEEDISIVELEFKNFEKEVEMLKKYMASTGYQPPGREEGPVEKKRTRAKKETGSVEPLTNMKLVERFTFENFVVGSSNRFASKAAEAVAENPAEAYNPLFIYGGSGLGKTHLLNSIGNKINQGKKKKHVVYTTTEKFTNDLMNAVGEEGLEAFREHYRKADILLIDDLEFISGQEATQEEFFNTFNHLVTHGRQIVTTSDRPPKEIPKLADRLKSRFEGGLIVDVAHPGLETKMVILKKEAKKMDLLLPDEVVHLLADRIVTNVRVLEGAVKRMAARVKMEGCEPNTELAEEILSDVLVDDEEAEFAQTLEALKEKISSLQDEEEEPAEESAPEPMVKCTACNKDIPATATVCPECGVSFEGEVYECPICHVEVPPGSSECPGCGAKFEI